MHIGNYFGAVRNWVDLQDRANCIYGIVDLHAMTVAYDPDELKRNTRMMFASLIACGIDPDRSRLFIQSRIPEHTELCWILSTMAAVGDLSRMTQYKEKSGVNEKSGVSQKPGVGGEPRAVVTDAGGTDAGGTDGGGTDAGGTDRFISSGLLFYPVLQAADILAYRPQLVPVGQDQKQHLELTRGIARRFNSRFGEEFFPEPEPLFTATPKIMSLADPVRKMSKSAGEKHYVGLFEDPDRIRKKVRSSVTDSGDVPTGEMSPGITNLIGLLDACGLAELARGFEGQYHEGGLRYVDLKDAVVDALVELTTPLRDRRAELENDPAQLDQMMADRSAEARELAADTLRGVRKLAGIGG